MTQIMHRFIIAWLFVSSASALWRTPTLRIHATSQTHCLPVGSDLAINCTKTTVGTEIKNITLERNYKILSPTAYSEQGIQVVVDNVTTGDAGTYRCCTDGVCGIDQLVYTVGEPAHEIKDFACVLYNQAYLECSWHSTDQCVNWTIQYKTSDAKGNRSNITQTHCDGEMTPLVPTCDDRSCVNKVDCIHNIYRVPDVSPLLYGVYDFTLAGQGRYGRATYSYSVYTNETIGDIMTGATCGAGDAHSSGTAVLAFGFYEVELGDLEPCTFRFQYTSVDICWNLTFPPNAFTLGIICEIHLSSKYTSINNTIEYKDENDNNEAKTYRLPTHPYTDYNASVKCQVKSSLYWGNTLMYPPFTTPQDVPLVGPSTSNESFTFWCAAEQQHILIYITPPSTFQRQGILTGYFMSITSSSFAEEKHFSYCNSSLTLGASQNIPCSYVHPEIYDMTIWAQTKKGRSRTATHLSIITEQNDVKEVIAEKHEYAYLVTWKSYTDNHTLDAVYHWCLVNMKRYQDGANWNVVCSESYNYAAAKENPQLISPGINTNGKLQWHFGVSIKNSGIRWQDCSFANSGPVTKPAKLQVKDGQILLPWNMRYCSEASKQGPRPLEYQLFYSDTTTNTEFSKIFSARSNMDPFELNLNDSTTYFIKYMIKYTSDQQSNYSAEIHVTTPSPHHDSSVPDTGFLPKLLGGLLGAIGFLSIVLILIYKGKERWRIIGDETKVEPVEFPDPEKTTSDNNRLFGTRTSQISVSNSICTCCSDGDTGNEAQNCIVDQQNICFQHDEEGYVRRAVELLNPPAGQSNTGVVQNTNIELTHIHEPTSAVLLDDEVDGHARAEQVTAIGITDRVGVGELQTTVSSRSDSDVSSSESCEIYSNTSGQHSSTNNHTLGHNAGDTANNMDVQLLNEHCSAESENNTQNYRELPMPVSSNETYARVDLLNRSTATDTPCFSNTASDSSCDSYVLAGMQNPSSPELQTHGSSSDSYVRVTNADGSSESNNWILPPHPIVVSTIQSCVLVNLHDSTIDVDVPAQRHIHPMTSSVQEYILADFTHGGTTSLTVCGIAPTRETAPMEASPEPTPDTPYITVHDMHSRLAGIAPNHEVVSPVYASNVSNITVEDSLSGVVPNRDTLSEAVATVSEIEPTREIVSGITPYIAVQDMSSLSGTALHSETVCDVASNRETISGVAPNRDTLSEAAATVSEIEPTREIVSGITPYIAVQDMSSLSGTALHSETVCDVASNRETISGVAPNRDTLSEAAATVSEIEPTREIVSGITPYIAVQDMSSLSGTALHSETVCDVASNRETISGVAPNRDTLSEAAATVSEIEPTREIVSGITPYIAVQDMPSALSGTALHSETVCDVASNRETISGVAPNPETLFETAANVSEITSTREIVSGITPYIAVQDMPSAIAGPALHSETVCDVASNRENISGVAPNMDTVSEAAATVPEIARYRETVSAIVPNRETARISDRTKF